MQQVLQSDQAVSEEFSISSATVVRLEGTIAASWDVESRRKDGSVWVSETEGSFQVGAKPSSTTRQVIVNGNRDMRYRINLGSGNHGPEGFIYTSSISVFK